MSQIYLLDSNTLIEAKDRFYGFDICPGFWDMLHKNHDTITTIDAIYEEITDGNDELSEWLKETKKKGKIKILDTSEEAVQKNFEVVANYVNGRYISGSRHLSRFLAKADPWLIAYAMTYGHTIVTFEKLDPDDSKKIKIPNVCKEFDVKYIDVFEMIRNIGATFHLT